MMKQFLKFKFSTTYTGLERWGIKCNNIHYNPSVSQLYSDAISHPEACDYNTRDTQLSSTGAMVAYSGLRTGRSPTDKRVVKDSLTENDIWWGKVNMPISPEANRFSRDVAIKYLNTRGKLYVVDGYAGWDPLYRLKCRIVCSRPYHALFMKNMLIRPSLEELRKDFQDDHNIDFHVFNAGHYHAPQPIEGTKCSTSIQANFTDKTYTILGSQYAGEMKKGIFGVMQYYMPKQNILSMHCSATEGTAGDVTLYFGLSGTGKTTLSADPKRKMLGDDEHCWSPTGVFNIEGGCYAKCIDLTREKEPEIYDAIKYGSIMENVLFHEPAEHRVVDYHNTSITENTRVSYPLEHIPTAKFPSMAGHAKNIIFLTCDAFGVLPPISRLTKEQASYHFISGYTAKVAGTEMGIKDPVPTFSACFGEAFIPLHPAVYADMLAEKMDQFNSNCYLINTGWSGGKFGEGQRMSLKLTRKIIDFVHEGDQNSVEWEDYPIFGFQVPKNIPGIDSDVLHPKNTWKDKAAYDQTLRKVAQAYVDNFKHYEDVASEAVRNAGPQL